LAAIFARLNLLEFLSAVFCRQSWATPHAKLVALRPSITSEWDQPAAEYIRKTCRRCLALANKNEVYIEYIVSQQPTTEQLVLFTT
jgi:hypothetical protein